MLSLNQVANVFNLLIYNMLTVFLWQFFFDFINCHKSAIKIRSVFEIFGHLHKKQKTCNYLKLQVLKAFRPF